ncbi:MAG: Asp23/Gls24 family envelope stress response protein [Clostridia bacterium]|nr:Asp23/Gls24 family envelope stress response protein [Clostridia bacterium]
MDEENKVNGELVELAVPTEPETNGIQIANEVVAVIAGKAVSDVPGVASMAGGFAGVFSGKKNVSRGIKVEANDKTTKIDVNIIVEYGHRIPDVAFEIQNRVKKAVETMTGLAVAEVNVHVQGVDIDIKKDENKPNGEKVESAE